MLYDMRPMRQTLSAPGLPNHLQGTTLSFEFRGVTYRVKGRSEALDFETFH